MAVSVYMPQGLLFLPTKSCSLLSWKLPLLNSRPRSVSNLFLCDFLLKVYVSFCVPYSSIPILSFILLLFVVVPSLSCVWLFTIPWIAGCWAFLSFTISLNVLKLMSIESVMPSNPLILCCPLLLLPSIFPASESFPMTQLYTSGGQSIGASSASVFQVNIQCWFPLGLTGLISLLFKDSQESSPSPQFESVNSLVFSLLYGPTLTSLPGYWKENIDLTTRTFVGKLISLLFNILFRFIIAFLPRNKHLLISWLQSPSAVIWEPEKIKSVTVSIFFPHLFAMKLWDWMPWS